MKKSRWAAGLMVLMIATQSAAIADWTPVDANLTAYQEAYPEADTDYKRIRYGAEEREISTIKDTLAALGYFPYKVSEKYHRTLEVAIRVFAGQMRLGSYDGREITPLMQAMLSDSGQLPKAISPVIEVPLYSWEPNGTAYTPYSYANINRTSVRQDVQVGFSGRITAARQDGDTWYYAVEMEGDPEKAIHVSYLPLPRTTVYQVGDTVAVFGITRGIQALPYAEMETGRLLVRADRVGYTP